MNKAKFEYGRVAKQLRRFSAKEVYASANLAPASKFARVMKSVHM